MKTLIALKAGLPHPSPANRARGTLILKTLFWVGLIICLGVLFLGQDPANVLAQDPRGFPPVPNLNLTITDDPDPVKIGNMLIYTIALSNDGTADATSVVLTSELDSHVTFVSASDGGDFNGTTGIVTWDVGTLAAGETISVTVTVTVDTIPDNKFLIANRVKADSAEGAADCDTATTTVIAPKLEIVKTDNPDPVPVGDLLTYTLVVSNVGYAEATGVVLTDTLDPDVSFASASDGGTHDGQPTDGVVTWDLGTIAPWEIVTRTVSVTVSKTTYGPLNNLACVSSYEGSDACDDEPTEVLRPELVVRKIDDPDPVGAGQPLTYLIEVTNVGQAKATDVIVADNLDSSVTFVSAGSGGTHDGVNPNGTVTWPSISMLQPGMSITRSVSVTVGQDVSCGSTFPNTAEATSSEGAGDDDTIETTIGNGLITVRACLDKNADGDCSGEDEIPPPAGVQACLVAGDDSEICLPVPAEFSVAPGSYAAHLEFTGDSQGYYPTIPSKIVAVEQCGIAEITLPAVNPVHPKGVAVHEPLNKVYVAFQGPKINGDKPYPFVAVIDGESDQVLGTIPGGASGIGRSPWGVAVSGDNVYVGSFDDGWVSVIDANTDTVMSNLEPSGDFQPAAPAVNPVNGWVHFPDYRGGRIVVIDGLNIIADPRVHIAPASFSPFEMVVADDGKQGHNFVTMRDALRPQRFKLASLSGLSGELNHPDIGLPNGGTGTPHAIGLWQQPGMNEPRFFITFADDPRPTNEPFPNPNKLAVYSFPLVNPKDVLQRNVNIVVGDYAEAGLIYDPTTDQMVGTFGGFAYDGSKDDLAACDSPERGGIYTTNFDGNVGPGFAPNIVVGSPKLVASDLAWKNPFEIAINPNNEKVYVSDRCWNDFPGGGREIGGAVLIYDRDANPQTAGTTAALENISQDLHAAGDANGDGIIDISDLSLIAGRFGSDDPAADINGDGVVDIYDMSIAAANYGLK